MVIIMTILILTILLRYRDGNNDVPITWLRPRSRTTSKNCAGSAATDPPRPAPCPGPLSSHRNGGSVSRFTSRILRAIPESGGELHRQIAVQVPAIIMTSALSRGRRTTVTYSEAILRGVWGYDGTRYKWSAILELFYS